MTGVVVITVLAYSVVFTPAALAAQNAASPPPVAVAPTAPLGDDAVHMADLRRELHDQQVAMHALQANLDRLAQAAHAEGGAGSAPPTTTVLTAPTLAPVSGAASAAPSATPVPDTPVSASDLRGTVSTSAAPDLATLAQRQAYASGVTLWREIAHSLDAQRAVGITLDPALVVTGLQDAARGQALRLSTEVIDTVMVTLNQQFLSLNDNVRTRNETDGATWRQAFRRQKGVMVDAGALYQVLAPGLGRRLLASDLVTLKVTGTLPDGTVFDASGTQGHTKRVKVGALLPAVVIGLQKVSVGGHIKVVVPPNKGYGDAGMPPTIPGGATLIFDILVDSKGDK